MEITTLLVILSVPSIVFTQKQEVQFSDSTTANVTCVPWTTDKPKCTCKNENFNGKVKCENYSQVLSILDCFCMTYDDASKSIEVGVCVENCMAIKSSLNDKLYRIDLPPTWENLYTLNSLMCVELFQRTGRLCGKCLNDLSPKAYSFNLTCVHCPDGNVNLWKYFVYALAPLTCFYFFVLFFKINTTSSHLHGYVIFAQTIATPEFGRILTTALKQKPEYRHPARLLASLYGFWNLDFFRYFDFKICLNMYPLTVVLLDYIIAVFPFLLTVLSYILIELHDRNYRLLVCIWKPFRYIFTLFRRKWDIRTSVVDAYATFFQLSCFKILCISFDLLAPTYVYTLGESEKEKLLAVYYDGTVDFLGSEHLPYFIVASVFLVLFVILPMLLFFIYPSGCFQYLLSRCHCHSHIVQTFMDSINGCYKDGTETGTKDCRWFAGIDLFSRIFLFSVFMLTLGSLYFPLAVLVILVIVICIFHFQPYKKTVAHYNKIDLTFYCLLGLFYTAISASNIAAIKSQFYTKTCYIIAIIICFIPLLYMSFLSIHWLFSRKKWGKTMFNRIRALIKGNHVHEATDLLPHRLISPDRYARSDDARLDSDNYTTSCSGAGHIYTD